MTSLIYQSDQAPWQKGGLVLLKISFLPRWSKAWRKGKEEWNVKLVSVQRSFIVCPLTSFCSHQGSVWVSPQFARDESPVAQPWKTGKDVERKGFSCTNPLQVERGPGDQLRLLNLCGNIPNMNLQGFVSWKVLLDTWSPQGWETISLEEKFYFFKAPFYLSELKSSYFFTNHQKNHWPAPPSPKTCTSFQWSKNSHPCGNGNGS